MDRRQSGRRAGNELWPDGGTGGKIPAPRRFRDGQEWTSKVGRPMQILDQLGAGEGMPKDAIRAATANRATVAPILAAALERHEAKNEIEENALFLAFHLLGQWREKSAYRQLARFLRWPEV